MSLNKDEIVAMLYEIIARAMTALRAVILILPAGESAKDSLSVVVCLKVLI